MNGSFNTTGFVLGMALAKDLPRNEAATTGFAASMFPAGNIFGAVMLKPLIDARAEAEARAKRAEEQLAAASQPEGDLGAVGSADITSVFGNLFSKEPTTAAGSSTGSGLNIGTAFFGASGMTAGEANDLKLKLQDREQKLEDQDRRHQREIQLVREDAANQVQDLKRLAHKEVTGLRNELQDQALQAQQDLLRQQSALAMRAAELDDREARVRDAEAALKSGGKFSSR